MLVQGAPYSELHRLLDRMEQRVMGLQDWSLWPRPAWDSPPFMEDLAYGPAFHVTEDAERFSIEAAMPGFDRDDLKVSVKGDCVHVLGKKKEEQGRGKRSSFWFRRYGAFSHTLRLPWYVDPKGASAKFKDGVLTISFPKGKMAGSRIIPIQGKGQMIGAGFGRFIEKIKRGLSSLVRNLGGR